MNMFLDDEEIADLTRRKRRIAQRTMLNSLGLQYKIRADGSFVILRAHVEHVLGGVVQKREKNTEPDWSYA